MPAFLLKICSYILIDDGGSMGAVIDRLWAECRRWRF